MQLPPSGLSVSVRPTLLTFCAVSYNIMCSCWLRNSTVMTHLACQSLRAKFSHPFCCSGITWGCVAPAQLLVRNTFSSNWEQAECILHLRILCVGWQSRTCKSRQKLKSLGESLEFLFFCSDGFTAQIYSQAVVLLFLIVISVSVQMFPLLSQPFACCCALDQRWCWAGGLLPVREEILFRGTTWIRERRAWKPGGRSMSNQPKNGSLRSMMPLNSIKLNSFKFNRWHISQAILPVWRSYSEPIIIIFPTFL